MKNIFILTFILLSHSIFANFPHFPQSFRFLAHPGLFVDAKLQLISFKNDFVGEGSKRMAKNGGLKDYLKLTHQVGKDEVTVSYTVVSIEGNFQKSNFQLNLIEKFTKTPAAIVITGIEKDDINSFVWNGIQRNIDRIGWY